MFFLGAIGVVLLVILLSQNGKKSTTQVDEQISTVNRQWVDFIAAYAPLAKTSSEKVLIARMLVELSHQGMPVPPQLLEQHELEMKHVQHPIVQAELASQANEYTAEAQPTPVSAPDPEQAQLDNISLLLYFGAFLFVASVGLFIGLGGASGGLRTFAVLLVLVVMYSAGMWLYRNRPKLQQAGLTFAAIGLVIAPLLGAAVYNYVTGKEHGAAVWLVTSTFCVFLYLHALVTFKKPLLSYLLIFTFLSLFESGVGVVSAPVYYFVWAMAVAGIVLQLLNRWKGYWPELREATGQSSQVLLPLALLASLAMVDQHGTLQLGVSLLLGGLFYALQTFQTGSTNRVSNAVASQVLGLAGVVVTAYGISGWWIVAGCSLLAANIVQLLVVVLRGRVSSLWTNFGSVLAVSSLVVVLLVWANHGAALAAAGVVCVVAAALWHWQRRADAYALATIAWVSLPFIYGQVVLSSQLTAETQSLISLVSLVPLVVTYLWLFPKNRESLAWRQAASISYVLGAVIVVLSSVFAPHVSTVLVTAGVIVTMLCVAERTHDSDWVECAGLLLAVPLVRTAHDHVLFLETTIGSLLFLVAASLRYRREILRWMSTFVWLLLPIAVGRVFVNPSWSSTAYAYAYLVAMVGLVISRAIARGVLFVSSKIPMAAYARSASLSYVVGYWVAAGLAVLVSLTGTNSQLNTSLILAALILLTYILSRKVERQTVLLALLPVLAQALLLSTVRPSPHTAALYAYVLVSSTTALASYYYATIRSHADQHSSAADVRTIRLISLLTAFVAPVSVVAVGYSIWPMPLSLVIAALVVLNYLHGADQTAKEIAGGGFTIAAWWFLGIWQVNQPQAYVDVLVATFSIYAYMRAQRGEAEASNGYLWAVLVTATVPLAFQALAGGPNGSMYGFWLLLQQVAIMLLGMAIHKSFVTRWGLYVAVAAVLYQLRGLGYAALAVLAVFLIGLAIYQLQKHDPSK